MGGALGRKSDLKERSGVTARAIVLESLGIEKVPASSGIDGNINVEQLGNSTTTGSLSASCATLSIRVFDYKSGADTSPICLEARLREHAVNDIIGIGNTSMMRETEIACTRGPQTLWSDRISRKVTVLARNANFGAVGCEDGCFQVNSCLTCIWFTFHHFIVVIISDILYHCLLSLYLYLTFIILNFLHIIMTKQPLETRSSLSNIIIFFFFFVVWSINVWNKSKIKNSINFKVSSHALIF